MGELSAALNEHNLDIESSPVSAELFATLVKRIEDQTLSGKLAKEVFEYMWQGEGDADTIIEQRGLKQISDTGALEEIIAAILKDSPDQVAQFKAGNDKIIGFFVGKVMQQTKGKANPVQVNELLQKLLQA